MNDYISRQAAIDALEQSKDKTAKGEVSGFYNAIIQKNINRLIRLPSADVVEVVHCKDCKHFEYDHPYIIQGIPVLGHEVCNAWGNGCKTDENGYCFMAERRTDGH